MIHMLIDRSFNKGVVPGTCTCLKWSLVPPDFKERLLHKIFMKIIQTLIKKKVPPVNSAGILEKC